ncbi:hypothetical protein CXB51_005561 [Gossypium anomalum]|uniref:Uncharacterized protein n=1 Tax=Gossypium anomalum TaxID=47600 RepID=A0A8J6D9V3_9ROSI|nr:hypothetical protein CXB51_005561 [Gossypium anomalum]
MPRRRLRDLSIAQNPPNLEETNSEQQTGIGSLNVPNTDYEPAEIQKALLLVGYLGIIARNANLLPINYKSWHHMPDSNKNQALDNIKERFVLEPRREIAKYPTGNAEEQSFGQKVGRLQLFDITHRKKDGSPTTTEATEIMEKLKDKRAEYEAIASSDTLLILTTLIIDTQQYMPSGSQTQAEVQRLRDQLAQMQVSTIEQIAQLKAEAAAREAEQSRKYNELQQQLQNMMKMFQ